MAGSSQGEPAICFSSSHRSGSFEVSPEGSVEATYDHYAATPVCFWKREGRPATASQPLGRPFKIACGAQAGRSSAAIGGCRAGCGRRSRLALSTASTRAELKTWLSFRSRSTASWRLFADHAADHEIGPGGDAPVRGRSLTKPIVWVSCFCRPMSPTVAVAATPPRAPINQIPTRGRDIGSPGRVALESELNDTYDCPTGAPRASSYANAANNDTRNDWRTIDV